MMQMEHTRFCPGVSTLVTYTASTTQVLYAFKDPSDDVSATITNTAAATDLSISGTGPANLFGYTHLTYTAIVRVLGNYAANAKVYEATETVGTVNPGDAGNVHAAAKTGSISYQVDYYQSEYTAILTLPNLPPAYVANTYTIPSRTKISTVAATAGALYYTNPTITAVTIGTGANADKVTFVGNTNGALFDAQAAHSIAFIGPTTNLTFDLQKVDIVGAELNSRHADWLSNPACVVLWLCSTIRRLATFWHTITQ